MFIYFKPILSWGGKCVQASPWNYVLGEDGFWISDLLKPGATAISFMSLSSTQKKANLLFSSIVLYLKHSHVIPNKVLTRVRVKGFCVVDVVSFTWPAAVIPATALAFLQLNCSRLTLAVIIPAALGSSRGGSFGAWCIYQTLEPLRVQQRGRGGCLGRGCPAGWGGFGDKAVLKG